MTNQEKQDFYKRCSEILGIDHVWNTPVPHRTRWNNRNIGNGRFPGFGLIRIYGDKFVVTSRKGTKLYDTKEQVYRAIR